MPIPTTAKPAAVAALEDLAAALRASRERTLGHPLAGDEEEIFARQLQGIIHLVAALDAECREYVLHSMVEDAVRDIVDEELAAGRLIDHGNDTYSKPEHLRGVGR